MREEEVGRAVEADRRLAGARPALDHERRLRLAGDQPVLVGLDRRDDVAHVRLAAPLELVEQEVAARDRARAVQLLVAQVEDPPTLGAKAATQRDVVRIGRRRDVERPRGRRLPVDDERSRCRRRAPSADRRRAAAASPRGRAARSRGRAPRPRTSEAAAPPTPRARAPRSRCRSRPQRARRDRACGRGTRRHGRRTPARRGGPGAPRRQGWARRLGLSSLVRRIRRSARASTIGGVELCARRDPRDRRPRGPDHQLRTRCSSPSAARRSSTSSTTTCAFAEPRDAHDGRPPAAPAALPGRRDGLVLLPEAGPGLGARVAGDDHRLHAERHRRRARSWPPTSRTSRGP